MIKFHDTFFDYYCTRCHDTHFTYYIDAIVHEQMVHKPATKDKVKKITKDVIEGKLQGKITTTEKYVYGILLPAIKAVAETSGMTSVLINEDSLVPEKDARLNKDFKFDYNIFEQLLTDFGYEIESIYDEYDDIEYLIISWEN